jgi:hypothetical protein
MTVVAPTLVAVLAFGTLYGSSASAEKPPVKAPADKRVTEKDAAVCTQVTGSVIAEGFGYKHVVSLRNGCDKPVHCQVWTDVDPTPRNALRVNPGETAEVITRIGSPAREFKALKECHF